MSNPWLKKNPFMSLWLSGANKIAGWARSQVAAETRRQLNAAVTQATEDNLKHWFGTPVAAGRKSKSKSKSKANPPRR